MWSCRLTTVGNATALPVKLSTFGKWKERSGVFSRAKILNDIRTTRDFLNQNLVKFP